MPRPSSWTPQDFPRIHILLIWFNAVNIMSTTMRDPFQGHRSPCNVPYITSSIGIARLEILDRPLVLRMRRDLEMPASRSCKVLAARDWYRSVLTSGKVLLKISNLWNFEAKRKGGSILGICRMPTGISIGGWVWMMIARMTGWRWSWLCRPCLRFPHPRVKQSQWSEWRDGWSVATPLH